MKTNRTAPDWRQRLYVVIFEAETRAGRLFDVGLIVAIFLSLAVVMLDSVASIAQRYHGILAVLEWFFTLLFSLEYLARLLCTPRPLRYATSFFGVVDLLSILPTYLAMFVPGLHTLIDVRVLRLLRIFRVFKLTKYFGEYVFLANALAASRRKIMVFLSVVLMAVLVCGTLMYVIEGPENGFTSIPMSIYWGITTMTTVGFGDITPKTDLGRLLASCMMLMGWGILAVPTGIVTAELTAGRYHAKGVTTRTCRQCLSEGLGMEDRFCRHCGAKLETVDAKDRPID